MSKLKYYTLNSVFGVDYRLYERWYQNKPNGDLETSLRSKFCEGMESMLKVCTPPTMLLDTSNKLRDGLYISSTEMFRVPYIRLHGYWYTLSDVGVLRYSNFLDELGAVKYTKRQIKALEALHGSDLMTVEMCRTLSVYERYHKRRFKDMFTYSFTSLHKVDIMYRNFLNN